MACIKYPRTAFALTPALSLIALVYKRFPSGYLIPRQSLKSFVTAATQRTKPIGGPLVIISVTTLPLRESDLL